MNEKQAEYLRQYGITEDEITSGKVDPAHRLQVANLAGKDEPAAEKEPESTTVEPTAAQAEFLRNLGKDVADLTPAQKDDYEFWGRRSAPTEDIPTEAAKPLPEAPVIVGPHTQYDMDKIAALSPWRRNEIADFIRLVQSGLKQNPSLNDQHSLAQAKFHLAPYVKK